MPSTKASHGQLQNIYRIIGYNQDDIDLTREQAVRLYHQLKVILWPRLRRPERRAKHGKH